MKEERQVSVREIVESNLATRHNPILKNLPGNAEARRREMQEVIEASPTLIIEKQFEQARQVLTRFGLVDGAGNPTHGGVPLPNIQKVADSFSMDQLKLALSSHFHRPTFLLVPEISFQSLRQAIDTHRVKRQELTLCTEPFNADDGRTERVSRWKPVIVEGANGPRINSLQPELTERLRDFVKRTHPVRGSVSYGLNRNDYAILIMLSMSESGKVEHLIDRNSSTILTGDPALDVSSETHRGIPIGKFRKYDPPKFPYENAVSFYMSQGHFSGNLYGGHWIRSAVAGNTIEE